MNSQALISIIIPVFNAEKYLQRCLTSVLEQTHKQFEVILVDDGSTDNSKEMYAAFVKQYKNFKSYYQNNSGPSTARNYGLTKAKGTYIAFVDADDYIEKGYLSELLEQMLVNHTDLSCCGYYELSNIYKNPLPINDFSQGDIGVISKEKYICSLFYGTAGVLWGKLFKNEIIKTKGIRFNPEVKMSEDLIFNLEYAFCTERIAVSTKHNYYYNRLNENAISANQNIHYIKYIKITNNSIEQLLNKNNFKSIAIPQLLAERTWRLTKLIGTQTALSYLSLKVKKRKIKQLITEGYIKNNLKKITEKKILNKMYLFLLRNNFKISFILFSKLINSMTKCTHIIRPR